MRFGAEIVAGVGFWFGLGVALAQGIAVNVPPSPLLPDGFGTWIKGGEPVANTGGLSLTTINKDALEESGPQRSQVQRYVRNDKGVVKGIEVQAIQFGDRSGAYSAFTLVSRPDMKPVKDLGTDAAVGDGAVVFYSGASLVVAVGAAEADVASLKPLAEALPKALGNKGLAPLLPTYVPVKGLVPGSLKYALGGATYQAEGGVLPSGSLGWAKSAEAVTAKLTDKRGQETLTILLYPTPTIAGAFAKTVKDETAGMGPAFGTSQIRREGELVMLANGTFSADEAQKMLENIHMKQVLSFDKDVQPVFHVEVAKTYSLLQEIVILFCILGGTAVVLGFFFGFGRAAIRKLQGKPAATEAEFLSLHLAPQNEAPKFEGGSQA
jgi:hypothetical protein